MKPKILVLGGSGFVGQAVVRALCEGGHAVRASYRKSVPAQSGRPGESGDVEWIQVDLDNAGSIRAAVQGCVAVIHVAGYEPKPSVGVAEARRRGVGELRGVLDECLAQGVVRIVYVSSVSTINSGDGERVYDETDFYTPGQYGDAYFEAKYSMEAELYRYFDKGLEIVVALPSLILGPGCLDSPSRELLNDVLKGLDSGAAMDEAEMKSANNPRMNIVDVRDVARALVAAMERGRAGRRYVLGGINTDVHRVRELFGQVLDEKNTSLKDFLGTSESVHFVANLADSVVGARALRIAHRISKYAPEPLVGSRVVEGLVVKTLGIGLSADSQSDRPQWYGVHVNSQRARGELGHRPRLLAQTVASSFLSAGSSKSDES